MTKKEEVLKEILDKLGDKKVEYFLYFLKNEKKIILLANAGKGPIEFLIENAIKKDVLLFVKELELTELPLPDKNELVYYTAS